MSTFSVHGPTSPRGGDWRAHAACAGDDDPDAMFPDTNSVAVVYALAYCRACPVLIQCREYALDKRIPDGIWGGLTEAERRAILRKRGINRMAGTGAVTTRKQKVAP